MLLDARLLGAVDELQPLGGAPADLALTPQVERARAAHQAQVGAEVAARGVEGARTAPEAQEHVLDDVLRLRGVAEDAERGRVDGAVMVD